ncbi:MAG: zinc ribbon domain-containing protein [bacterium]
MTINLGRAVCIRCGRDHPDTARFCDSCGAPLGVETPERYGALRRIAGGYRFLARLTGIVGALVTAGSLAALWRESVMLAGLAALGLSLAVYVAVVALTGLGEAITAILDLEDHTRKLLARADARPRFEKEPTSR